MLLTAADLAYARQMQERTMTSSADVYRRTISSDGMGGQTIVRTKVSTVICRVAPSSPEIAVVQAGKLLEEGVYRVTFPALTDVKTTDQLVVETKTLEVLTVNDGGTYETARITLCAEVV